MDEEADAYVGPELAEQPGDELQLVVVHPDGGAWRGLTGGRLGEPPVDVRVRLPPGAVELRGRDDVVVERPQGRVGEALVVVLDLGRRQRDADQVHAVVVEGLRRIPGCSHPAHPRALGGAHHRLHRRDEATGADPPLELAARRLDLVHGQPVGDHDEGVAAGSRGHAGAVRLGGHTPILAPRSPMYTGGGPLVIPRRCSEPGSPRVVPPRGSRCRSA